MGQENTDPRTKGADGNGAEAAVSSTPPPPEPNGTPVDVASHNPDPNAHNWLHPEKDLNLWDSAFGSGNIGSDHGDPDAVGNPDPMEDPSGEPLADNTGRQRLIIAAIVVAVMAVMGVTIWLLVNMLSSGPQQSAPEPSSEPSTSDQPLPHEVSALDFKLGDCFADFDSEANTAMAVACDTGHSAQLVFVFRYPAEDRYPGRDALKTKAQEACKAAKLTPKVGAYAAKYKFVYPSPTSWDKGDRRVDCFVVVDNGNSITENLIQQP